MPTAQSVTTGKTTQKGGKVEVTVFANAVKSWVTVRFVCDGQGEGGDAASTVYEAEGNSGKRYDYGRSFKLKLAKVPVIDVKTKDEQAFKATVTVKGKIAKTSKKATKGSGTVLIEAPGCSTGTLTWKGKGRIRTTG